MMDCEDAAKMIDHWLRLARLHRQQDTPKSNAHAIRLERLASQMAEIAPGDCWGIPTVVDLRPPPIKEPKLKASRSYKPRRKSGDC